MVVKFICRRHPSPTKEMLEPLLRTAAAVGLDLDVSSSKALADSLDHAVVTSIYQTCATLILRLSIAFEKASNCNMWVWSPEMLVWKMIIAQGILFCLYPNTLLLTVLIAWLRI